MKPFANPVLKFRRLVLGLDPEKMFLALDFLLALSGVAAICGAALTADAALQGIPCLIGSVYLGLAAMIYFMLHRNLMGTALCNAHLVLAFTISVMLSNWLAIAASILALICAVNASPNDEKQGVPVWAGFALSSVLLVLLALLCRMLAAL
jgi:glucan phosphoethanolaminetransferase (alkaline phosphatase superfamily)